MEIIITLILAITLVGYSVLFVHNICRFLGFGKVRPDVEKLILEMGEAINKSNEALEQAIRHMELLNEQHEEVNTGLFSFRQKVPIESYWLTPDKIIVSRKVLRIKKLHTENQCYFAAKRTDHLFLPHLILKEFSADTSIKKMELISSNIEDRGLSKPDIASVNSSANLACFA